MNDKPKDPKQEKATFYSFELSNKKGKLFFRSKDTLNEQIFIYLSKKLYPSIVVSVRTNTLFQNILGWLFKSEKKIPNKNVFLIYKGYDSTVYFYKETSKVSVIREKNNIFKEEIFKGFPIHYDFSLNHIPNKDIIIKILKEHFALLKAGKEKIHGDFTNYNILIDSDNNVSIIDPKDTKSLSILTDHFYFYSYFLIRTRLSNRFNKQLVRSIEEELSEIYYEVFKDENISILDEIDKIRTEDFVYSNDKQTFEYWKNKYYNLMVKIVK